MGKSQRTKGATYEREVCKWLEERFGRAVTRNIGQARDGGNDIDYGPLLIECKRRKTLTTIESWMQQAVDSVAAWMRRERRGAVPVPLVVCRADNGASLVILRADDFALIAKPWMQDHFNRETT
jgi:Holliday junction resolvase